MLWLLTYDEVHELMALANLIILVSFLSALIILGIFLQRKKKFVWHGDAMLVVMMVAGLLTLAHMGPSLVWVVVEAVYSFNLVALLGIIHGVIGALTLSLGVWLVGAWAFAASGETRFCAPKRKLMRRIAMLWIVALALGLIYYPLHLILG